MNVWKTFSGNSEAQEFIFIFWLLFDFELIFFFFIQAFENSSRMKMKSLSHLAHQQQAQRHLASIAANNHLAVAAHLAGSAGAKQQNRQQSPAAASLMNQFISTTSANLGGVVNNSVASYHAMNGTGNVPNGALTSAGSTPNSHHGIGSSPVGGAASLTNGFSGIDHHHAAYSLGATVNGLGSVFGTGGPGSGSASAGSLFSAAGAAGSQTTNQPPTGTPSGPFSSYQYFYHQQQQHLNFQQQQQQQIAAAMQHPGSWSPASGLFSANSASKFLTGMTGAGSPQQQAHPASSSTPPTTSVIGQSRASSLAGVVSSLTSGGFGTNRVQTSSSATTANVVINSSSIMNNTNQLTEDDNQNGSGNVSQDDEDNVDIDDIDEDGFQYNDSNDSAGTNSQQQQLMPPPPPPPASTLTMQQQSCQPLSSINHLTSIDSATNKINVTATAMNSGRLITVNGPLSLPNTIVAMVPAVQHHSDVDYHHR